VLELLLALGAGAWLLGREFMGTVTANAGVQLDGLAPEGYTIVGAIDRAARLFNVDLMITSAVRPEDTDSMHSVGKALDVRTLTLTSEQIVALYWWFTVELGPTFIVLFESPNPSSLPSELKAIVYYNPAATGPHLHLGVRKP
jgi:hypothetical protein